jgi:hypothetical protein
LDDYFRVIACELVAQPPYRFTFKSSLI